MSIRLGSTLMMGLFMAMCAVGGMATADSISIVTPADGSRAVYNTASTGVAQVGCECQRQCSGGHQCGYTHPTPTWSSDDLANVDETWSPSSSGYAPTLSLTALPSSNGSFGNYHITVQATDTGSHTHTVKLFFNRSATNHPGEGAGSTANWYFYWRLTDANFESPVYDGGSAHGYTDWKTIGGLTAWYAFVGNSDYDSYPVPTRMPRTTGPAMAPDSGEIYEGIDNFAWTARHEEQHRVKYAEWFPNGPSDVAQYDLDNDFLRDDAESGLGGSEVGGPFDPAKKDTNENGYEDGQDYTCHTQDWWDQEDARSQDWSCPGQQCDCTPCG